MENLLKEIFRLRTNDFNCYDELTPSAILDLFQDLAGKHADQLKIGYEDMLKKNLIWVVIRTKFEIIQSTKLYSSVEVSTWPKQKGRADFDREYEIRDLEGNILVKGISKWVVVNHQTRRIQHSRNIEYPCEINPKENFPGSFDKIEDFDITDCVCYESQTSFSDLDHNGHVNNSKYAVFIMNALSLPSNQKICSFEINYLKELAPNSKIRMFLKKEHPYIYCKGLNEMGETNFIAKIGIQ